MQIVTANNIDINEILNQMIFINEIILLSIISLSLFILISLFGLLANHRGLVAGIGEIISGSNIKDI